VAGDEKPGYRAEEAAGADGFVRGDQVQVGDERASIGAGIDVRPG
jgi:hypothetical protein